MPSYTLPYRDPYKNGLLRPWLSLQLTGINRRTGRVWGLIDSGADKTSLPLDYAALMGYTAAHLEQTDVGVADGSVVSCWAAKTPAIAYLPGLATYKFEIYPTFMRGDAVLWGRLDFFRAFVVTLDENAQAFALGTR